MGDLSKLLDEHYGTTKVAEDSEAEKAAEAANVQLFLKLAADNNIDVDAMLKTEQGSAKVAELWDTFQKHASAEDTTETPAAPAAEAVEATKTVEAAADAELAEKKANAKKIAEADFCGRVMAHAFVQEQRKIASGDASISKEAASVAGAKTAEFPPKKDDDKGEDKKDGDQKDDKGDKPMPPFMKKSDDKDEKKEASVAAALTSALEKVKAAAATETETVSAIDVLAAEQAVLKVAQAYGAEEAEKAAKKIAAADTLGLFKPSDKLASATSREQAVDWRACEMLETVGYPINWQ